MSERSDGSDRVSLLVEKVSRTNISRVREGEEESGAKTSAAFRENRFRNGARSDGRRSNSHMPVRGQFAAASAAGSVSSGSVRASVTPNLRHGGAQEKQETQR